MRPKWAGSGRQLWAGDDHSRQRMAPEAGRSGGNECRNGRSRPYRNCRRDHRDSCPGIRARLPIRYKGSGRLRAGRKPKCRLLRPALNRWQRRCGKMTEMRLQQCLVLPRTAPAQRARTRKAVTEKIQPFAFVEIWSSMNTVQIDFCRHETKLQTPESWRRENENAANTAM